MDVNLILIAALDTYSLDLGAYKGDTVAIANAISKCKDYLSHNTVFRFTCLYYLSWDKPPHSLKGQIPHPQTLHLFNYQRIMKAYHSL